MPDLTQTRITDTLTPKVTDKDSSTIKRTSDFPDDRGPLPTKKQKVSNVSISDQAVASPGDNAPEEVTPSDIISEEVVQPGPSRQPNLSDEEFNQFAHMFYTMQATASKFLPKSALDPSQNPFLDLQGLANQEVPSATKVFKTSNKSSVKGASSFPATRPTDLLTPVPPQENIVRPEGPKPRPTLRKQQELFDKWLASQGYPATDDYSDWEDDVQREEQDHEDCFEEHPEDTNTGSSNQDAFSKGQVAEILSRIGALQDHQSRFEERINDSIQEQFRNIRGGTDEPPTEKPFSVQVAEESWEKDSLLEKLYGSYSAIFRIPAQNNRNNKDSYVLNFSSCESGGFWDTPKPFASDHNGVPDKIGVFPKLTPPEMLNHWKLGQEIPQRDKEEENDRYLDHEKDATTEEQLRISAVPGRHLDAKMDAFLNGKPLVTYKKKSFSDGGNGKYLTLDQDIFFNKPDIKWDAPVQLPSLEYKSRQIAKDGYSIQTMITQLRDKGKSLLTNWTTPNQWSNELGVIKDAQGNPVPHIDNTLMKDSVTKDQLITEIHNMVRMLELAYKQTEHQAYVFRAQNSEIKMAMREIVLNSTTDKNVHQLLKDYVNQSRLSTETLFGPIPEYLSHKMLHQPTGYHKLRLKERVYLPAPTPKGKPYGKPRGKPSPQFRGGSSGRGGNRGRAFDSSKLQHQQNSKPGSKNPQGGGGPPTKPRGNQANRGRGQSRRGRGRRGGR